MENCLPAVTDWPVFGQLRSQVPYEPLAVLLLLPGAHLDMSTPPCGSTARQLHSQLMKITSPPHLLLTRAFLVRLSDETEWSGCGLPWWREVVAVVPRDPTGCCRRRQW